MRITTRTRYAIRALYDLAFHRLGQAAGAKEIAERQKIPLRFLEQILQDLRKAGIVEARRGPRGGYALARPPAQISLAEVLHAVRGPLEEMFGFDAPATAAATTCRRRSGPTCARAGRRARARDAAGLRDARRGGGRQARRAAGDDVLHLMARMTPTRDRRAASWTASDARRWCACAAWPAPGAAAVVVKCEQMNPGGSVKDRAGAGDDRGGRARGAPASPGAR